MNSAAPTVRHNADAQRFELEVDGATAVLLYEMHAGRIQLLHTEVPPAHRGRGYGDLLARTALEYARSEGMEVDVLCPFVRQFIERHPEYRW